MNLQIDPEPKFAEYAHPERLVSTDWLAGHLGEPGLAILESDEDTLLYETGHVPGALKLDWHEDLNDAVTRDYLTGADFAQLMSVRGIHREDTIVVYGDNSNWWAAYALWVLSLFGHQDVRLLDGGRTKWVAEGRPLTSGSWLPPISDYPVVERVDHHIRAFREDVLAHMGDPASRPMVDVRSIEEYTGERMHMPDYPQEGTLRAGHVPGAVSIPWGRATQPDSTFKPRAELEAIYASEQGLQPQDDIISYCRIGERSSHTWFVLTHLLGYPTVRNYDGSWTEWGNAVRAPIAKGPGPCVPGAGPPTADPAT